MTVQHMFVMQRISEVVLSLQNNTLSPSTKLILSVFIRSTYGAARFDLKVVMLW